ncbi:NTF2-like protein [Rhizopus microsporus var. microsporus]|uniref:NTF2-like protein n=1 Tax=Rhizopus microsporus var. microsporus TaxID=86635 RepID=A0A1X0QWT8_RHIZD|nr:NTF2-like protein [Rhizopus microsporus var. microsporus]
MSESKGLFAMFGAAIPAATLEKKEDDKWQTATNKKSSRGLALKAKAAGKTVTVTENKKKILDEGEDIDMGGMGKKKKNRKRFNPYGRPKPAEKKMEATPAERIDLLITGFEPGTEAGIIPFLVQKSKKQWQAVDAQINQGQMLLTVSDPVIARILIRLDGYIFGTQQLQIRLFDPNSPLAAALQPSSPENGKLTTIDILRNFLKSRWNVETKYLNLDDMASDPILKKSAIRPPGAPGSNAIVGPAMMKLAGEMFQDILSISFARNHLKNVQQISTLAQYLPNIQNISLSDNLIKEYEGLEAISGTGKLKNLRELYLVGNPLRESEFKQRNSDRAYIRNIVKRFPTLVLLDGMPIHLTEEEAAAVHKTGRVLPLDNQPNFFDSEITRSVTVDFLCKFFQAFDQDRPTLSILYDADSVFSITTNVKLRSQQKLKRKDKKKLMDDEEMLNWTSISRNLMGKSKRQEGKGLLIGPEAIGSTFCRLPKTIHDLQKTEDFIVDAHQSPAGLVICLHGEFKEEESSPPYSYDRTFLLRPAAPTSPATAAGWPYTIMSDMLCVRDYIGNQGFKPQAPVPTSIFASYPV